MPVLHKKRQAACGVCYVRGTAVPQCCIPHPPPKATAKLSIEREWGRTRTVPLLGTDIGQPQSHPQMGTAAAAAASLGITATKRTAENLVACQSLL